MLIVNIVAKTTPFNQYESSQPGQNLFLAAGYTYGIWWFINLLMAGFCLMSTYLLTKQKPGTEGLQTLARQESPWFWMSSLLYTGWLYTWHQGQYGIATLLMVLLFISVVRIYIYVERSTAELSYVQHVTLETPFIIYFSWLTTMFTSSIASWLVAAGWQGGPLSPEIWACVLVVLIAIIGTVLSRPRPAYCAITLWSLIGIYVQQARANPVIGYVVIGAGIMCLIGATNGFLKRRKEVFK